MLASLGSTLARAVGISSGADEPSDLVVLGQPPETTGIKVEVWVELGQSLETKVTRFAAKMVKPHACGQWLVCDWEVHEKSNNPSFNGFQKIYRKKYKPTKNKVVCEVVMNSDNNTDSNSEVWGHVMKVLNEFAPMDVHIERESSKSLRGKKR